MILSEKAGILKIYVGESDRYHGRPLFEEIIYEARNSGLAGATAYKGIMSFGASHSIHTMKIMALSDEMPVIIEIVDNLDTLDHFMEKINVIMDECKKGGLVTLEEINVIRYEKGEKYRLFSKHS